MASSPLRGLTIDVNTGSQRWWLAPLTAFLVTRALIAAAVLLGDAVLPGFNDTWIYTSGSVPADFVNAWARWDTNWYTGIVESGYGYSPDSMSSVAFFPLYPLTIALLKPMIGSALVTALLISNGCFLAALLLLYRLTLLKLGDEGVAGRAAFYIAAFPYGFVFSAGYTESLFLLVSVGAVYCAMRRWWLAAGLLGALAAATRAQGVLLIIPIGLEWLVAHGWTVSTISHAESWRSLWRGLRTDGLSLAAACLPIPAGVLAYMAYLQVNFDDPLLFVKAQDAWTYGNVGVIEVLRRDLAKLSAGELYPLFVLDILCLFVVLFLSIPIARKMGAGWAFYTAFSVLIPASSRIISITRYTVVVFPVFMLLALWGRHRAFDLTYRVVCLTLLPLFTLAFIKWVFIG